MGGLPSQGSGGPSVPGDKHRTYRAKLRYNDKTIDPRQIRVLAFDTDSIDISGSDITISGTSDVNVTDRADRLLGYIYGSQDSRLQQRSITSELLVQLANEGIQIDPRDRNWDLNFATDQVDVTGSTITTTNAPTTPINDFNTDTVSSGSSSTHTYTATGNFKLTSIQASASGAIKIEVKAGTSGSETTRMVAFTIGSNLIAQLEFHNEVQITIGQRIQVIRTNREAQAMDVFSTILGFNM